METPHISKARLQALLFDSVRLTEEEDAHIARWDCQECKNVIMELVPGLVEPPLDPSTE